MKIAIDAMGGDNAPLEIVKGAIEASIKYAIPVILVGDQDVLKSILTKHLVTGANIEIIHASEVVHMDEHPANVIRKKPDSSIVKCAELVKSGKAQAMVSAGNTGAAMSVATLGLGRIPGVLRPAIGSIMPNINGKCVMLDAGANVDCSVENMFQFAIMGNAYAERVFDVENPKIGLLSIGEEPSKGNELTKSTNKYLSESDLNFIGNVEGKEIFRGAADVVVCDGFDGNVVLKVTEGVAEFLFTALKNEINKNFINKISAAIVRPLLSGFKNRFDYAEYGGAPLLGVNGVCIIGHGRSNSKAVMNAIKAAAHAVEHDVVGCIAESMKKTNMRN